MKKIVLLGVLSVGMAFAQMETSSITGLVLDPTGAAVPAADVQVANIATSLTNKTVTNEKGEFVVPQIPGGTYRVTVTKTGFKAAAVDGISVQPGVPATVNVKLEVGQTSETIEVSAGAEIVQATSADVSSSLTGRQLTDLPFATRNAIELLVDVPGTQTPTNPRSSSINGLPKGAINITFDGMNTQDNNLKSSDGFFSYIMPSVDAMEEVTLTTSAAGVDSTGQGGAQIKFVTRSGTNTWHGGGFWQDRNTFFNSNYYYNNNAGLPRDIIKLNQEGGHIGGPIKKNKLFFFGNVEIYRFPGTNQYNRTYLTPSAASGIFTYADATGTVHNVNLLQLAAAANPSLPAGTRPYATTADPILAKTYSTIAQLAGSGGIVKNNIATGDYNTNTVSYQPNGTDSRDFYTTRIDYNINDKQQVSFIYNFDKYVSIPDFLNNVVPEFPGTGTVLFSNVNTGQRSNRFDGTLSHRWAISPRLTNELRGGLNGGTVLFFDALAPGLYSPWKGFRPTFASPGTSLSNVSSTLSGQRRNAPVKDIADTMSWIKGSHQLSFGGEWDQINLFQQIEGSAMFPSIAMGIASNDPIFTGSTSIFTAANLPGANSSQLSNAANLYADVTGRVSSITQGLALSEGNKQYTSTAPIDRDHMRELALFFQDTWRIKSNLTATLGLRMEKQFAFVNQDGLYTEVTYPALWGTSGVGSLFQPGANSGVVPTYTPITSSPYTPPLVAAPSVGLAWQLRGSEGPLSFLTGHHDGAAVLRGGYSISTVREGMNVYTSLFGGNQGLTLDASVSPSTYPAIFGAPGSVNFSDPTLPSRIPTLPSTPSFPLPASFTASLNGFDPNLKMGYVQSWNLSLQRELGKNMVLDVRYTGNHGTDLWRQMALDEVNIFENGFLNEFKIAANNLAIARGGNITSQTTNNFGNQGLPGQQNIPIISTALGTTNDSTSATYLMMGQAGSFANSIATNASRMANLTATASTACGGKPCPANLFVVNPTVASGNSFVLSNTGASYFNALQVEWRRRMTNGFTIQGSYQFAKSEALGATASSSDFSTPTTLRNLGLDRVPSGFDIRNDIKFNWIYELPFGAGRAFGSGIHNGFARRVIEGWEIAGVVRLQSGTPLPLSGLSTFNGSSGTGAGVVLHNVTLSQLQSMMGVYKSNIVGGSGPEVFYLPPPSQLTGLNSTNNTNIVTNTMAAFNVGGFSPAQVNPNAPYIGPAPAGQLGYETFLYLPWQRHFDLSLTKNTRIRENVQLQIGAHALDVLNITNFLPGSNTTSSTFGQITSAYRDISGTVDPGARIIEFVVRLNF
ncbi:MAG TPA: carboxypeptidase-like regulatory domain-containing protein [Bryobacteraceae bacterium]|nr:carboxypeptidase-like regulatory domain-containing protein [Bryobacteraceae bacterium]